MGEKFAKKNSWDEIIIKIKEKKILNNLSSDMGCQMYKIWIIGLVLAVLEGECMRDYDNKEILIFFI